MARWQSRLVAVLSSLMLLLGLGLQPGEAAGPRHRPPEQRACESGFFPATGQTTQYKANLNDGVRKDVLVPDDGFIRAGKAQSYHDNGNGTITDLNTGLTWEKKDMRGGLHDVGNTYLWSGNGTQNTIWDFLRAVNTEQLGGHTDWRIPNVKELQSILDYEASLVAVDSAFHSNCSSGCQASTCSCTRAALYWSSTTTFGTLSLDAWYVDFQ